MRKALGKKVTHQIQFTGNDSVAKHVRTKWRRVSVATKSQHCLVFATMRNMRMGPTMRNAMSREINVTADTTGGMHSIARIHGQVRWCRGEGTSPTGRKLTELVDLPSWVEGKPEERRKEDIARDDWQARRSDDY